MRRAGAGGVAGTAERITYYSIAGTRIHKRVILTFAQDCPGKVGFWILHPPPCGEGVQTGDIGNTRSETWVTVLNLVSFGLNVE
jgi:hypothetical protein